MPASNDGRNSGIFVETFHVASVVYFVTHIPITVFLDSQIGEDRPFPNLNPDIQIT